MSETKNLPPLYRQLKQPLYDTVLIRASGDCFSRGFEVPFGDCDYAGEVKTFVDTNMPISGSLPERTQFYLWGFSVEPADGRLDEAWLEVYYRSSFVFYFDHMPWVRVPLSAIPVNTVAPEEGALKRYSSVTLNPEDQLWESLEVVDFKTKDYESLPKHYQERRIYDMTTEQRPICVRPKERFSVEIETGSLSLRSGGPKWIGMRIYMNGIFFVDFRDHKGV